MMVTLRRAGQFDPVQFFPARFDPDQINTSGYFRRWSIL